MSAAVSLALQDVWLPNSLRAKCSSLRTPLLLGALLRPSRAGKALASNAERGSSEKAQLLTGFVFPLRREEAGMLAK